MVILDRAKRTLAYLAGLVILIFLGYQLFTAFYSTIQTESAVNFDYTDGIKTTGYIIRNESLVHSDHSGTLHFAVSDGAKVAKDGVIANVYASDAASAAATRATEIEQQLAQIDEIEGYNNLAAVDLSVLNAKITAYLDRYIYGASDGNYTDLSDSISGLLTAMTRKKVVTGEQSDFSLLKASLNSELASLRATVGTPKGSVIADRAGYFVSTVDGYETSLSTDDLSVYKPEYFKNLSPADTDDSVVGKIVYDYEWYIAAPVSLNDSMFYKIGDVVTLKTSLLSNPRITAAVERINLSDSGSDAVILFSCNEMSSELASMRSGAMTIIRQEYNGLKISTDALRVIDGATGVYVISGIEAKFVTAEILYSNDEYAICELNSRDNGKLRLYDEVILKGKNLYDGKIIY